MGGLGIGLSALGAFGDFAANEQWRQRYDQQYEELRKYLGQTSPALLNEFYGNATNILNQQANRGARGLAEYDQSTGRIMPTYGRYRGAMLGEHDANQGAVQNRADTRSGDVMGVLGAGMNDTGAGYDARARDIGAGYEARERDIGGAYQNRRNRIMADLESYGASGAQDIDRRFNNARGGVAQDLIDSGLSNTTIRASMNEGVERRRNQAQAEHSDRVRLMKSDADARLSGEQLDALSRLSGERLGAQGQLSGDRLAFRERATGAAADAMERLSGAGLDVARGGAAGRTALAAGSLDAEANAERGREEGRLNQWQSSQDQWNDLSRQLALAGVDMMERNRGMDAAAIGGREFMQPTANPLSQIGAGLAQYRAAQQQAEALNRGNEWWRPFANAGAGAAYTGLTGFPYMGR